MNGRIIEKIEKIDYWDTLDFFNKRAQKFKEDNPYSVTMYQDSNPEIVDQRNKKEIGKLLPLLELNRESRVLDLACGIGRWSDAISQDIDCYCGIDFSEELIKIAKKRNEEKENRFFFTGRLSDLKLLLNEAEKTDFNRILLIGSIMYLNDEDVENVIAQINSVCEERTVICIREPVGLKARLTLKGYYSDELKDYYNAIYRTANELKKLFDKNLAVNGFVLREEGILFEDESLNNRKETSQYYFIYKR